MNKNRVAKIKTALQPIYNAGVDLGMPHQWKEIASAFRRKGAGKDLTFEETFLTKFGLCYASQFRQNIGAGIRMLKEIKTALGFSGEYFWPLDASGCRKRDSLAQDIAEAINQLHSI